MTDLERAARAIFDLNARRYQAAWREQFGDDPDDDPWPTWAAAQPKAKAQLIEDVQAALRALLPPSEAMVEAGRAKMLHFNSEYVSHEDGAAEVFTAMLGAILKDSE